MDLPLKVEEVRVGITEAIPRENSRAKQVVTTTPILVEGQDDEVTGHIGFRWGQTIGAGNRHHVSG